MATDNGLAARELKNQNNTLALNRCNVIFWSYFYFEKIFLKEVKEELV